MARAEVAGVASRLLPEGVRPDAETIKKIEAAIDATTVNVPSGASYADEMNAKQKNEKKCQINCVKKCAPDMFG